jgi:hypothetical protein
MANEMVSCLRSSQPWLGRSHSPYCLHARPDAAVAIADLQAEVERLRGALNGLKALRASACANERLYRGQLPQIQGGGRE